MKHTMMFAAIAVVTLAVHANPTNVKEGLLASKDGKTLYIFDKDEAGKSNCNGGCAAAWPPFAVVNAALATGDFSIVKRDDGTSQWAFKNRPLYFFAGDVKAGDAKGDNQGGQWHVLRRDSKKTSSVPDASFSAGYNYN